MNVHLDSLIKYDSLFFYENKLVRLSYTCQQTCFQSLTAVAILL